MASGSFPLRSNDFSQAWHPGNWELWERWETLSQVSHSANCETCESCEKDHPTPTGLVSGFPKFPKFPNSQGMGTWENSIGRRRVKGEHT